MQFLKKNLLFVLLSLVVLIMLISLVLTKRNNAIITENLILKHQAEDIKQTNYMILRELLHGTDLGLRGYALTKNEGLLQPFKNAAAASVEIFSHLETELTSQNYELTELRNVNKKVDEYIQFNKGMADDILNDRKDVFLNKLNEDRGFFAWKAWDDHTKKLIVFEDNLITKADLEVTHAMAQNLWLKIVLMIFSVPTFALALFIVNRQNRKTKDLLMGLEMNNRKYLFDPGTEMKNLTEAEILEASIQNMRHTAHFVKSVAAGNYENEWIGLNQTNAALNEHTIAGELLQMQKQMLEVKMADERRLWANEGLAKFSEVIRNNQDDLSKMAKLSVSFLTKHLNAWQSCIYIKQMDPITGEDILVTGAQFAPDGKKSSQEKIHPGEGIIGQAYLDASPIQLLEISESYWQINSGLGSALPANILVIPFQFNQKVSAVFEIASFAKFSADEIEFLQKAGEYFASATSLFDAKETSFGH